MQAMISPFQYPVRASPVRLSCLFYPSIEYLRIPCDMLHSISLVALPDKLPLTFDIRAGNSDLFLAGSFLWSARMLVDPLVKYISPPARELGNEGHDPEPAGEEVFQADRIFRGYCAADVLVPRAFQHLQVGSGQFPLQAKPPEIRVNGDGLEVSESFQILILEV